MIFLSSLWKWYSSCNKPKFMVYRNYLPDHHYLILLLLLLLIEVTALINIWNGWLFADQSNIGGIWIAGKIIWSGASSLSDICSFGGTVINFSCSRYQIVLRDKRTILRRGSKGEERQWCTCSKEKEDRSVNFTISWYCFVPSLGIFYFVKIRSGRKQHQADTRQMWSEVKTTIIRGNDNDLEKYIIAK